MDFVEKHKALILTVLFCSVLILGLYNFHLTKKERIRTEMLLDLDEFEQEETEEEQNEEEPPENTEEETEQETQEQVQTHRAFNEEEQAREENFNRELEEILDRNSASQTETSEEESDEQEGEYNIERTQQDSQETSDGEGTSEEISRQSGGIDNSSISYSLKGRNAIHIPNPIYTCDRAGKVVVNIKVNAKGYVTDTSINKASSTTRNQCLLEKALAYAAGARFSALPGRNNQPGTITYYFQP